MSSVFNSGDSSVRGPGSKPPREMVEAWWAIPIERLITILETQPGGLSTEETSKRLSRFGPNLVRPREELTRWRTLTKLSNENGLSWRGALSYSEADGSGYH